MALVLLKENNSAKLFWNPCLNGSYGPDEFRQMQTQCKHIHQTETVTSTPHSLQVGLTKIQASFIIFFYHAALHDFFFRTYSFTANDLWLLPWGLRIWSFLHSHTLWGCWPWSTSWATWTPWAGPDKKWRSAIDFVVLGLTALWDNISVYIRPYQLLKETKYRAPDNFHSGFSIYQRKFYSFQ